MHNRITIAICGTAIWMYAASTPSVPRTTAVSAMDAARPNERAADRIDQVKAAAELRRLLTERQNALHQRVEALGVLSERDSEYARDALAVAKSDELRGALDLAASSRERVAIREKLVAHLREFKAEWQALHEV